MIRFLIAAAASFVMLSAPAVASVTATPMSDPTVAVSQGQPLATLFQTDTAATLDLNTNYSTTLTTSNGSACPTVSIRRGTSRYRCTLGAGDYVLDRTFALAATTYQTAYLGGTVAASIAYLTTPLFNATAWTFTCAYSKSWGFRPAYPLSICPAGTSYPNGTVVWP